MSATSTTIGAASSGVRTGRARRARAPRPANPANTATARISSPTHMASGSPMSSGVHGSGPIGSPVVREASHSPTTTAVAAAASTNSLRDGRRRVATASASWAAASTAMNTPNGEYSATCCGTTAAWIAAAPTLSSAALNTPSGL